MLSVTKLTDQLLQQAVTRRASDIHLEDCQDFGRIRFRINGVLEEVGQISGELWPQLVSRYKILAKLDIAERRLPQDGHFIFQFQNSEYDCRLSCCPVVYGEKLVVRILNPLAGIPALNQLGLDDNEQMILRSVLESSQGMLLVTGPTGSGKTLTLYSSLQTLNLVERNISTIEDPAEIKLYGINQTEINPKIHLCFATVLRSLLRQDPDVIMVGEIRDLETAEIAVQAAYTGHLVLSTLHTNSAAATIIRLVDMGIPVLNVVSSLKLIVAQRLIRLLCPYCKQAYQPKKVDETNYGLTAGDVVYLANPTGCEHCVHGYHGRKAIFELLMVDEELKRFMLDTGKLGCLSRFLTEHRHQTLWQKGMRQVKYGVTSLSEIVRVVN